MTLRWLALSLSCYTALCSPLVVDKTSNVSYRGLLSESGTVEHFHGIHYAESTAGANRFAPPQPLQPFAAGTLIDATKRGAACPQLQIDLLPFFSRPPEISEDCLSLFIARPANIDTSDQDSLPVLAWLHGGGAMYGSGSDPHTNPDKLIDLSVELDQPVIFVGVNYRMGFLGFAASDALQAQQSENVGMRDQRLAFEWIQENIHIFGGDPARVTAYGLSAGGTFTSLHHVAYAGAKGVPFSQAYMMSGPTGTARNQTTDSTKINTAIVAERLDCPTSGQEMLDCMRAVDVDRVVDVSYGYAREHHPPYGLFTYVPVVDGDFLPERSSKLLREGKFAKNIPTILAWTEDDGATNAGPAPTVHDEESLHEALQPWTSPVMNDAQMADLLRLYAASDFEERASDYNRRKAPQSPPISPHWYRVSAFVRDLLFTCSSIEFTHHMYRHTRTSGANPDFDNVRLYQLNQSMLNPLFNSLGMDYIGTAHGSDTNYIFNGLFPEGSVGESDAELSKMFTASVIAFATTGNPVSVKGDSTFKNWPAAYDGVAFDAEQSGVMPSSLNLQVIGGPHGTTSVHITKNAELSARKQAENTSLLNQVVDAFGTMQQAFMDASGSMERRKTLLAKQEVERQRIFERCEFVNSLAETMGV